MSFATAANLEEGISTPFVPTMASTGGDSTISALAIDNVLVMDEGSNIAYTGNVTLPTTSVVEPAVVQEGGNPLITPVTYIEDCALPPPITNAKPLPPMLTTQSLRKMLQNFNESIARLQQQRITTEELDDQGLAILESVRQIFCDIEIFLRSKNQDEAIQQFIRQLYEFFGMLRGSKSISSLAQLWRDTLTPFLSASDARTIIFSSKAVWQDLQGMGSIFQLAAETLRLFELMLAEDTGRRIQAKKAGQRDKMFNQILVVLRVISANPRWREAWAQREIGVNQQNSRVPQGDVFDAINEITHSCGWKLLEENLKNILKSMAGPDSSVVDELWDSFYATYNDLDHTPGYHDFISDAFETLVEILEDPPVLEHPATRHELRNLYNTLVQMLEEIKDRPNMRRAQQEAHKLVDAIKKDEVNHRLILHLSRFGRLISPSSTNHLFDIHLAAQFKHLFVPFLVETFREIKIPPIQGSTDEKKVKYHVQGVVLSSLELIPENIHIEVTYKTNNDPLRLSLHEAETIISVEAEKIKARVRGAAWSYERVAFPKMKDEGLASIVLGGHGARVGLKLKVRTRGKERVTKLLDSYCVIDDMDIALYECKHRFIYSLCHGAIARSLKKSLERNIAEKLAQVVDVIDQRMVLSVHQAKQATLSRASSLRRLRTQPSAENILTADPYRPAAASSTATATSQTQPKTRSRLRKYITRAREYAETRAAYARRPSLSVRRPSLSFRRSSTSLRSSLRSSKGSTDTLTIPATTTTTATSTTTLQSSTLSSSIPIAKSGESLPPAPSEPTLASTIPPTSSLQSSSSLPPSLHKKSKSKKHVTLDSQGSYMVGATTTTTTTTATTAIQ